MGAFIMSRLILILTVLLTAPLASATFIAEKDLKVFSTSSLPANTAEPEFKNLVARLQSLYEPHARLFGGKLRIDGQWSNNKLNAQAAQMQGTWKVEITGGLARRPELTTDGLALILCHELGHHFGGFPFGVRSPMEKVWAANEGQSDYFATQVCARRLWRADPENFNFRDQVPASVITACQVAWASTDDQALCWRINAAVASMIKTMAQLMQKPEPQFETPDSSVVSKTVDNHPAIQCRLDTSFQASLCPIEFDPYSIPGKEISAGPQSPESELAAYQNSCSTWAKDLFGFRPTCWFAPRF
jgi:hypothetical protein